MVRQPPPVVGLRPHLRPRAQQRAPTASAAPSRRTSGSPPQKSRPPGASTAWTRRWGATPPSHGSPRRHRNRSDQTAARSRPLCRYTRLRVCRQGRRRPASGVGGGRATGVGVSRKGRGGGGTAKIAGAWPGEAGRQHRTAPYRAAQRRCQVEGAAAVRPRAQRGRRRPREAGGRRGRHPHRQGRSCPAWRKQWTTIKHLVKDPGERSSLHAVSSALLAASSTPRAMHH